MFLDFVFNIMPVIASLVFFYLLSLKCVLNMLLSLLIIAANLILLHCGTAKALFPCLSLLQSLWPCRQSPAGCWDNFFIAASVSKEKIFWKIQSKSWMSACWVAWLNRRIDSAKFWLFSFFFLVLKKSDLGSSPNNKQNKTFLARTRNRLAY